MPPDASAPVLTVNSPTRIGPSAARTMAGATTLDRPIPATPDTKWRREILVMFAPSYFL
jgi:hypothetical protein